MKIKKIGHCCLVVEINGKRIMMDPGIFSTAQKDEKNIDFILYTHEHQDHYHLETLKEVLKNNPNAKIITNTAVGKLLTLSGINFIKIENEETFDFDGIKIKGFGNIHAEIYGEYGRVQNTGYMIDNLCFPGDAFEDPKTKIDILALSISGPWVKAKNSIDYAKKVNPRIVFPVHDATFSEYAAFTYNLFEHFMTEAKIGFKKLELGRVEEI